MNARTLFLGTLFLLSIGSCLPGGAKNLQSPAPDTNTIADPEEIARWQQQAANVEILRDKWGIAHIYGKSDADAVFGMIYAQVEDDLNRVETNA